jgi:hypothetical protein
MFFIGLSVMFNYAFLPIYALYTMIPYILVTGFCDDIKYLYIFKGTSDVAEGLIFSISWIQMTRQWLK